jgi:hypothetical protein
MQYTALIAAPRSAVNEFVIIERSTKFSCGSCITGLVLRASGSPSASECGSPRLVAPASEQRFVSRPLVQLAELIPVPSGQSIEFRSMSSTRGPSRLHFSTL